MKKAITLITILLNFGYIQAQAPAIQWQKCYGGSLFEEPTDIKLTSDGGYVVVGKSESNDGNVTGNHGIYDFWIVKLDATGSIQWQKCFGGTNYDFANAIQTTSDGGYIVVGNSNSTNGDVTGNHGNDDCWVVKLDATGSIQWQKSLGGSNRDVGFDIQTTSDGGYIVAANSRSNNGDVIGNHGAQDYWIVKLDASGAIQWQKSYGGTGDENVSAIQITSDGGYVVIGTSSSNNGDVTGNHGAGDCWVLKLDATGILQWQKSLGGSNEEGGKSIKITSDGGYIIAGFSFSTNGNVTQNYGDSDCWVIKLDVTGNLQWQKSLGSYGTDNAFAVELTSDGGYLIAGINAQDCWVLKLDATGVLLWQKSFGGPNGDFAYAIKTIPDGSYVCAGFSAENGGDVTGNHGGGDYWIVKLGPDLATPVFEKQAIVIYPNPVCNELQIQSTANTTITSAKIITINGQVVLEQTQNSNTINVENLAQGMYILEAYSGEEKYTNKFVKE